MDIVVRTRGESEAAIGAIRTVVAELDREVTLSEFETFESAISGAVAGPRFTAALGGALAIISLVLAGTGLYGLLAFGVVQRRREFSVRMVVGATRSDILRLVLHRGLVLVILGLVVGLAICIPISHYLDSLLYEVSPTDSATYAGVCTFVFVMALAATYLPARQAMRIEPIVSLRHE
jgi:putative ABC transport system permease protein